MRQINPIFKTGHFVLLFLTLFLAQGWVGFVSHGLCVERENAVVKAVRRVSPAVVNISSEIEVVQRSNPFSGLGSNPFFDSFFKDFFDHRYDNRIKRSSLGSGVIIDGRRGFILTNDHVIAKATSITVVLNDKREFKAQVVGADTDSDLAVLRIPTKDPIPAVEMASSDDLMIGETVIAIGNPFGFSNTVTTGVISAVNRSINTEDKVFHDFIQTDASINPGNSGGPLLNINGELIGINSAIYAKAQGIGFAIPIDKARRVVADLIQYGEVIPVWTGIIGQELDEHLAAYLKVPDIKGMLIKDIEKGSPAQKAGLKEGDILIAFGGKRVTSPHEFRTLMKNYKTGDAVELSLLRGRTTRKLTLRPAVFPISRAPELIERLLGIKVDDINPAQRNRYRLYTKQGVVITAIDRQSYLAGIGAKTGDVIRQMDDVTIDNLKTFEKTIIKFRRKKTVVILLQRGNQGYYLTIKL